MMNKIEANLKKQVVTVEAGVNSGQINTFLFKRGYFVPLGFARLVGVSGLSMGGGAGLVTSSRGLSVDQIISLEIITADGTVIDASSKNNSDLFWALRGAGGGNFGVVTKLTLKIYKPPKCVFGVKKSYDNQFSANIFYTFQSYLTSEQEDRSVFASLLINEPMTGKTLVDFLITNDIDSECEYSLRKLQTMFPDIAKQDVKVYDNYYDVVNEKAEETEFPPFMLPLCQLTVNFFGHKRLSYNESKRAMSLIADAGRETSMYVFGSGGKVNDILPTETAY
ncbi:dehydrogenase-like protein [Leptotrombidium deliense]|uniref:Dehydrogenase-like protein n=1 Tax=Leptotrombidium deliense TaxID=299467 RepID=A0A443SAV2_9ACAR|nr:dehydrogenase-like protein [Leptotrombidium deliense]